jgi:prepilin-type N-terminal cleavage/methylation domain-containing protein
MKVARHQSVPAQSGFTLIEMIGVLAIIAVLAGMLVPRVFSAINDSAISRLVVNLHWVRSAGTSYIAKYGRLGRAGGLPLNLLTHTNEAAHWDTAVLVPELLFEQSFSSRLGTTAVIELVAAEGVDADPATAPSAYDFDGSTVAPSLANEASGGTFVLQCRLTEVGVEDAQAINRLLDGPTLGVSSGDDTKGRVKYLLDGTTGSCTVRIYLLHK